jgi:hypothetical protein
LQGSHSIYAPCEVQIALRPLGRAEVPCIIYPVPEDWQPEVIKRYPWDLVTTEAWTFEKGERLGPESLRARWTRGMYGTRGGADTSGVLQDFLVLAQQPLTPDVSPATIAQVVQFVTTWGPLWRCRTPTHFTNGLCYWDPDIVIPQHGKSTPCSWRPVEPVYAFVRQAWQVDTVLQAYAWLQGGQTCDDHACWELIGIPPPPSIGRSSTASSHQSHHYTPGGQ